MTDPSSGIKSERLRSAIRKHFHGLVPYQPIVPTDVLSKEVGLSQEGIIKLDGNENPYGPSPRALEAIRNFDSYHIYPDPTQRELRIALGEYVGLPADHITVGNGSDEPMDLLVRLLVDPGDAVITCSPTFGMYPFEADINAGRLVDVPRDADFNLDLPKVIEAAKDETAKIIFLASPNNPTGNPLLPHELKALLETGIVVVVDEAYQEFSALPSYSKFVPEYENLVVLRTFSKWAGLAGLRVGYAAMSPVLVRYIDQIKPPYNVNVAALVAAQASLEDKGVLLERVHWMIDERERMMRGLAAIGFLGPIPSQANFILNRVHGQDAGDIKHSLERRGIFIKHVDTPYLPNAIRISVGKPEHTDAVLAALKEFC